MAGKADRMLLFKLNGSSYFSYIYLLFHKVLIDGELMFMRVLMFGWEFPPYKTGGLGTACDGLTRGLKNMGAEVTFVIPQSSGAESPDHVKLIGAADISEEKWQIEEYTHVKLVKVDVPLEPYARPENYFELHRMQRQGIDVKIVEFPKKNTQKCDPYGGDLYNRIREYTIQAGIIAKHEKFDIIHAHDWMTYQAGIEAKRISGKPLVVHVHSTEYDRTGGNTANSDIWGIERLGVTEADHVIAVSNRTKHRAMIDYGVPTSKVSVVYNAIDTNGGILNKYPKRILGKKVVLFLGRITVQKGPEYFLEAASKVAKVDPDAVFVMAGSGDMMHKMVERSCDLNIGHKVLFTGFVTGPILDMTYDMADVYVMPSVSEPFGITPLEAMSRGVPVIISKQSGVSEVVQNALKVDFWDVDKLADEIIGLLKNKVLRDSMSETGIYEIGKFSWDRAALHCINIYGKTIDKNLESLSEVLPEPMHIAPLVEDPGRLRQLGLKLPVISGATVPNIDLDDQIDIPVATISQ